MAIFLVLCFIYLGSLQSEATNLTFPDDFLFGIATSAYQIEGGWNEGGRSESIWDHALHQNPSIVKDQSNGDIACDSYHKWREDVKLVKELGVDFYRFSISWSRILPKGLKGSKPNKEAISYYSNLIDELLLEGIEPYVTIFHWDTPQILEEKGGWLNETTIDDYVYYARLLFTLYGDRVKKWITFNEFNQICELGYSKGSLAPFVKEPGIGGYKCFHHCVISHGIVYRMYEREFKKTQGGQVGAAIDCFYLQPANESEIEATERMMQFKYGWFVNPILIGNYPRIMIDRIGEISRREGFNESRLPSFTEGQVEMIRGSFDFLGLNHYTTWICWDNDNNNLPKPSFDVDSGVICKPNYTMKSSASTWLWEYPEGLRKNLNWIKEHYGNVQVLITENGWSTNGKLLNDVSRMEYFQQYLQELLKAIYIDECNVIGYTAWSLMDNFEWTSGFTEKFGLVHVDFDNINRTRTPRKSYEMYKQIIETREVRDSECADLY